MFGFCQYQIVFIFWYSVISENRIIFGICIRLKKGIHHTLYENKWVYMFNEQITQEFLVFKFVIFFYAFLIY